MNKIIIITILIIIFIFIYTNYYEGFSGNDYLITTANPIAINEIQGRNLLGTIGIQYHLKMDKQGRVEKITYEPPSPESGETNCNTTQCPSWYNNVVCWKCQ